MGRLRIICLSVVALAGAAMAASPAAAQITANECGLATQSVTATLFYDPFSTTQNFSSVPVTLQLTRFDGSGGKKTQNANFYFGQPTGSPAFQILSGGVNVLYTETCQSNGCSGAGAPALTPNGNAAGTINVNFGGQGLPNTVAVPVVITIPNGVDLSNGLNVKFDIFYQCNGTGGFTDQTTNQFLSQAVIMPVSVLSALQANYAGPAMDFGNVLGATNVSFATFHAPTTGTSVINVKSSGPYTVNLSSANSYLLKDTSTDTIKYSLHFLGRDLTNASSSFATINCARAGVTTTKQLPLKGTLGEAASGKAIASYSDTLTVTITPTNFAGATQTCETL